MDEEFLFWVPAQEFPEGIRPGFYDCVSRDYVAEMLTMGAHNVSDIPSAWRKYEAQERALAERDL